jgi:Arc/MetJ-type ribon-helix-helix transcriptional regulator
MEGVLHAVAEFLKLNQRTAFALFAAGVALWLLLHLNIITRDPVELGIAYLAAFGFFIWFHFATAGVASALRLWLGRRAAKAAAAKQAAAAAHQAELDRLAAVEDMASAQSRTIANIGHLKPEEFETVAWMHHQQRFRIRANQRWAEIDQLTRLGILEIENREQLATDRFFSMPDHVKVALRALLGEPRKELVNTAPPWETRSRPSGWA